MRVLTLATEAANTSDQEALAMLGAEASKGIFGEHSGWRLFGTTVAADEAAKSNGTFEDRCEKVAAGIAAGRLAQHSGWGLFRLDFEVAAKPTCTFEDLVTNGYFR